MVRPPVGGPGDCRGPKGHHLLQGRFHQLGFARGCCGILQESHPGGLRHPANAEQACSNPPFSYDVENFSTLPAVRLVDSASALFRGQNNKDIRPSRHTLKHLVSSLYSFQATRLHDTLYALLGLAADIKPAPPLPQGGQLRRGDSPELSLRRVGNTILDMPIMVVDYSSLSA